TASRGLRTTSTTPSGRSSTKRSGSTSDRGHADGHPMMEDIPMRSTRPLFGFLLGTVMLLGLIDASPTEAQTPKRGGTLRVSYGNEIAGLDFHTSPGYEMMWVGMNVGCGLINITPDGKFVPDAAESWQMSSDGLLYTF